MPHDESSARFGRITLGRLDEAFRAIVGEEEGRSIDVAGPGADLDVIALGAPQRAFRNCDGPPPDDRSLGHPSSTRIA